MGIAKVFESKAMREFVAGFDEFLEKAGSAIHYELWTDPQQFKHLSLSARAKEGHIIKFEMVGDPLDGGDEKYLLKQLSVLEAKNGVKITPGKWY